MDETASAVIATEPGSRARPVQPPDRRHDPHRFFLITSAGMAALLATAWLTLTRKLVT